MRKKMLILTGPQGAGNHLWSKIFSLHPEVFGWKTLLDNYWEAHRFYEPFCKCWKNHNLLQEFDLQFFMTGTDKSLFSFLSTNTEYYNISN